MVLDGRRSRLWALAAVVDNVRIVGAGRDRAVLTIWAVAAVMALAGPGAALAATGEPLGSATDNLCDAGAAASGAPTPPAAAPVASLALRPGSNPSAEPVAAGAVLTAPALVTHDASGSSASAPLTVRATNGYCAWHGDAASRYAFQGATARHEYTTPGFYRPWVYAIDSADVWSARAYGPTFYVNGPPTASFEVGSLAAQVGKPLAFTSDSSDLEEQRYKEPLTHAWDLDGDGSYDDGATRAVSFTYRSAGTYGVRLRVTDSNGVQRFAETDVRVSAAPAGQATSTPSRRRTRPTVPAVMETGQALPTDPSGQVAVAGADGGTLVFLAPRLLARFTMSRYRTRVRLLALRSLVRGSLARVRCRGRGCPRAQAVRVKSKKALRFRRFERLLGARAMIEVVVTKPGTVGRYLRLRMRRGAAPTRRELCVPTGARPQAC